jgi:hypothetical protein
MINVSGMCKYGYEYVFMFARDIFMYYMHRIIKRA